MGSSGGSTLSRENGGTYDVNQAERNAKTEMENMVNNNHNSIISNGTLGSQDGMDTARRKVRNCTRAKYFWVGVETRVAGSCGK